MAVCLMNRRFLITNCALEKGTGWQAGLRRRKGNHDRRDENLSDSTSLPPEGLTATGWIHPAGDAMSASHVGINLSGARQARSLYGVSILSILLRIAINCVDGLDRCLVLSDSIFGRSQRHHGCLINRRMGVLRDAQRPHCGDLLGRP